MQDVVSQFKRAFLYTFGCIILCCWFVRYFLSTLQLHCGTGNHTTQTRQHPLCAIQLNTINCSSRWHNNLQQNCFIFPSLQYNMFRLCWRETATLWESPHLDVSGPSVSELIMMYASLRQIALMYCSRLQTCLWLPSKSSLWFRVPWCSL